MTSFPSTARKSALILMSICLVTFSTSSFSQLFSGPKGPHTLPSRSTQQFYDSKTDLMRELSRGYTGDADSDFVRQAIALHEALIEAAAIRQKYGQDEKLGSAAESMAHASREQIERLKLWAEDNSHPSLERIGKSAERSQGSRGYASMVRTCVKGGFNYKSDPDDSTNWTAGYRVSLGSGGDPRKVEIIRTSQNEEFDQAVLEALKSCDPFPRPPGGKYPSYIDGAYRLR